MRFVERHVKIPEGFLVGQPIRLADFQEVFYYAVLDNHSITRRAFMSIARKNAKSATIATLLIVFLVGPEARQNSQIVSGAMSREQAGLIWSLAAKMIAMSETLCDLVHVIPSSKKLIGLPMNVEYKALSAEGKTTHGLSPVLAILDEMGQVKGPQDDFIDAVTTSQGAHKNALLVVISTQAPTDADWLSVQLDDAETSKDPRIVSHVYSAAREADVSDESAWYAANPALGIFLNLQEIEDQARIAERMPSAENTFRNLGLNQRISVVSPFVSRSVWELCGGAPDELDGLEVYGGLDLSARVDLTCAAFSARDKKGVIQTAVYFWTPEVGLIDRAKRDRVPYDLWVRQGFLRTTPGSTVDYGFVITELAEITANWNLVAIAFDRWRISIFKRDMENLGIDFPMIEMGQGFKDMSGALDTIEAEMLNGRLRHGMNPVLTMCAANAVVTKDPAGNRKLDKHKANGRIDGMQALAMSVGAMGSEVAEKPKEFKMFFV